MIVFAFLLFALSRQTFSSDTTPGKGPGLWYDPEFRLGILIVAAVPVMLFVRHWIAALEIGDEQNLMAGLRAFWGALFTALSFLSTTGFVSTEWVTARDWSGLATPGIILMGLALIGGGVATTAGGVKLMRVYALYLNGAREIERLVYPHSVGRAQLVSRRIRREGGFIAWVVFMMVAVTLAGLSILLGLAGIAFEQSMVLTIATLSNTGPLTAVAGAEPIALLGLPVAAKALICAGMVLGRLELLAIIVMLSPDIWRD
jgi:trk system potassium uptake protein TrkH